MASIQNRTDTKTADHGKPVSDDTNAKTQRAVQSAAVGGRLLLALAAHPAPMTLKDLAAQAAMPPSRAHPYLVSFARLGLVQQDSDSGRYALGPAALQMGLTALHQCDPVRLAGPVADALAARTGQAVALALWGNFGPTVVRMRDARQPLHVTMRVGTVMSLAGTATGRAFAGVLPPERIADALSASALGDPGRPAQADLAALRALRAEARADLDRHGCTRAVGRPIPGVNAFSAPVFDHAGAPVLAITLLGHQDHVNAAWQGPMARALRQAAAEVSAQLGYRAG
jgi:DNA-binding IclR family transcriptional regulator